MARIIWWINTKKSRLTNMTNINHDEINPRVSVSIEAFEGYTYIHMQQRLLYHPDMICAFGAFDPRRNLSPRSDRDPISSEQESKRDTWSMRRHASSFSRFLFLSLLSLLFFSLSSPFSTSRGRARAGAGVRVCTTRTGRVCREPTHPLCTQTT